jgi:hypothetical protein
MATVQHLQRCRYELKYVIDEPCARQVRDFARSYLTRDPHADPSLNWSYPIYSIYLDSGDHKLFHATEQGLKNRYKLRIRYYDPGASVVYPEIKRRVQDIMFKDRAAVRRDALDGLLRGRLPTRDDLVDPENLDEFEAHKRFWQLARDIDARPKVIVYYRREAWVTMSDDNVRLTFDRNIAAARYEGTLRPPRWVSPRMSDPVLELKFENRFPQWMRELTINCNLYKTCMGKYVVSLPRVAVDTPHASRL